ncbi:type I-E CRISPR-associated protein Cas6/Cse3/CasE [Saccharopolyspora hordei]|uniref:CRISPR system Cascade subunit CasE n=1 Tax=Saccharopolyspora hordei TaxID=1838 RepID=A0A853AKH1_9PSEU|nr:CRISPR system Cascade subunit CasE [Saccharopolyspora hordei]
MYLSRLTPDTTAHAFRRDHCDLHQMHRTIMSGFPDTTAGTPARTHHAVLWRLDPARTGFTLYVQSRTRPSWDHLDGYLSRPAEVRDLSPLLDALQPGQSFAFRLMGNPTKRLRLEDQGDPDRVSRRDNRYPILKPEAQITWLIKQGAKHGFAIPADTGDRPDVAVTSFPRLTGLQSGQRLNKLTVSPVRYDGHLIITDRDAFIEAVANGVGPAKSYGCGLLSLAPPHRN